MPDIAMCKGLDCPIKAQCFRHTGKPMDKWQSYVDSFYDTSEGSCEYFRDNSPKNLSQLLNRWEEDMGF